MAVTLHGGTTRKDTQTNHHQKTKPMKKTPKKYPMNGPSLHIQQLMERPRHNKEELQKWAEAHPTMRPETLAIVILK